MPYIAHQMARNLIMGLPVYTRTLFRPRKPIKSRRNAHCLQSKNIQEGNLFSHFSISLSRLTPKATEIL